MLGRCTRSALLHRFHGFSDGVGHVEWLVANRGHESVTAWSDGRCIGLATLAEGDGRHDLAVLVEDAWQRHGVGTRLVGRLILWARTRGVEEIGADVMDDDAFVSQALRRVGPLRASLSSGVYSARMDLTSVPDTR